MTPAGPASRGRSRQARRAAPAVAFKPPSVLYASMDQEIVPPTERICERCGRRDVWDDETEHWAIAMEDGERRVGDPNCIHEWDISGRHNPVNARD